MAVQDGTRADHIVLRKPFLKLPHIRRLFGTQIISAKYVSREDSLGGCCKGVNLHQVVTAYH
jgi:hypothetical protein